MRVFRSFEEAAEIRNPVVTTGSFDGVHIGHKTILNRLKMLAEKHNGESVLVTFEPHPRKVLYPDTAGKDLKLITSHEEKLELLREAGLDNVIIIEFTREFSRITSEQFVRDYLCGILHARVVVVGFNHHFGFNQEGDYRQLWSWQGKYSFEAEEIPEQEVEHETVSSTKIRQAIREGYIQKANAYLDHYYIIMGKPVTCDYFNPHFPVSFYEIPLSGDGKLLPVSGIYAVSFESGMYRSKGMVVIDKKHPGETEVFLNIFEKMPECFALTPVISFHKKIHGAVNLADNFASAARMKTAATEISDLIY
ncbi:MAG: adenylyltransferase/cytidyltransferase family protein [Bacteroidales bacterium]